MVALPEGGLHVESASPNAWTTEVTSATEAQPSAPSRLKGSARTSTAECRNLPRQTWRAEEPVALLENFGRELAELHVQPVATAQCTPRKCAPRPLGISRG